MQPDTTVLPRAKPPAVLLTCLALLAGLAVAAGVVAAGVILLHEEKTGQYRTIAVAGAAACVFGGAAVGCILWAVAYMVRRQSRVALLQENLIRPLRQAQPVGVEAEIIPLEDAGEQEPATGFLGLGPSDRQLLRGMLAQLTEMNENLLLTGDQREAKRVNRQARIARQLAEEIEWAIKEGEFALADKRLQELDDKVPGEARLDELRQRLGEARQVARKRDLQDQTRQIDDLMAVAAFERADEVARNLQAKYPDDQAAGGMLKRVRREWELFRNERHQRLYHEVLRYAESRQWRAALGAARKFIEAFGDIPDADAVRAMMPTIEDNARLEEVREIRDRICDLIQRRRYAEAVELAEDVILRFPNTRAAGELSAQLDRLIDLSKTAPGGGSVKR